MSALSSLSRIALAVAALSAGLAHAGGPLSTCNGAPLRYTGTATVNLNYDGGGNLGARGTPPAPLVTRTKAEADAIVTAAAARWTNVSTATIVLGRGADLPVDVTVANYNTYYGAFSDGLNPVIYDTDGTIINAVLGAGNSTTVLGFAGSAFFGAPTCRYAEGRAVINGSINISDARMTTVLAHELGHLIGLDHSQLDNSPQGLASSNFPLMYPFAARTLDSLHEDDLAAVSALYPHSSVTTTYGTLNGNFRLADGITGIRGANIWARDVANPSRVYSSVSNYTLASPANGFFSMLLPPGTYTLHAEAIESDHNEGSSVGPYSENFPADPSFQPPLYVGGVPMAPLTLGNASPVQFVISAGCTATANFLFNGTGAITGNCSGTMPPPPGSPPRLGNLSTRMQVRTGNDVLIGGFVVGGAASKTVVVRARGPSLVPFGITNALADPTLQLVRSSDSATLATNDDWQMASNAASITASGFAPSNTLESAILMNLAPGAYTAIVAGFGGGTGVGIIEVFEVDAPATPLANISTRGQVLTGNDVMIGGFVVTGDGPQTVVVRARGPSLVPFGITNALGNPTLQLVRSSDSVTLATNDNWGAASNAAAITASGFAPSNALEAAILITLNPGAYTAIVSGAGGATGVGIVEVFTTP